jgi:hypothetical protein
MKDIGLLLAHEDTQGAVLEQGLDWEAATKGNAPKKKEEAAGAHLRADGADPSDLYEQRWGLVVPQGPAGKRLREIVAPLVALREEQQGGKAIVYEVPPNMSVEETWAWWSDVYLSDTHDGKPLDQADRPRYLLALGGPELISWEFQTTAGADIFLGRLAFPAEADYEAYVHKVRKHEGAQASSPARAIFHTVRDGTQATNVGYEGLMMPALEAARRGAEKKSFATRDIVVLGQDSMDVSVEDFLQAAAAPTPTMLFSVSHGIGASRRGWRTTEEQHRFQGAMKFGDGVKLSHEEVAKGAFLPGGAWFFFACLGAGTPSTSEYHHWLKALQDLGLFPGRLEEVLASLPAAGQPPFVARLPQAALANPDGPISVVGHVDLAWTFGFQEVRVVKDPRTNQDKVETKSRSSRFEDIFRQMVAGKRMGAAYSALNTVFNTCNGELTSIFNREARDAAQGIATVEDHAKKVKKATLWMERQDIAAYVTLGDPAARLNVAAARAHVATLPAAAPMPASVATPVPAPAAAPAPSGSKVQKLASIEKMEQAILPILTEDSTAKKVAEKLGVERDDVTAWVNAYQAAGRAALEKL